MGVQSSAENVMNAILATLAICAGLLATPLAAQEQRWANRGWETDFSQTTIDLGEIRDVIGKDQIPAIDDPEFAPAADETRIPEREPVVAFEHDGVARAYPLRYLMWHEIVNDTVAGLPVAITYCPLCNTAVVFERTLDGEPTTFGTTGKLRHSDLIMYDRAGQTWWQQFNGEGLVGARAGERLKSLPSFLISFGQFLERYPGGEVLQPDPRRVRMAGENPYVAYDSSDAPFLFNGEMPDDIAPMIRVALVQSANPPAAATLSFLRENAPVTINGHEFSWQAGQASALDTRQISEGRDVGTIEVVDAESGEPATYMVTFAFAARAFLPDLEIRMLPSDAPDPAR